MHVPRRFFPSLRVPVRPLAWLALLAPAPLAAQASLPAELVPTVARAVAASRAHVAERFPANARGAGGGALLVDPAGLLEGNAAARSALRAALGPGVSEARRIHGVLGCPEPVTGAAAACTTNNPRVVYAVSAVEREASQVRITVEVSAPIVPARPPRAARLERKLVYLAPIAADGSIGEPVLSLSI